MAQYPLVIALGDRGSGYIDPYTPSIYLSNNKRAVVEVPQGTPLQAIAKAVKTGVLRVVEGSLEDEMTDLPREAKSDEVQAPAEPEAVEPEPEVVEEDQEEVVVQEEEKPKKCAGKTKKGKACTNNALPGSDYCGMHQPN